jgi:uncharacterized membrane protein YcaP (DUF421 family)
MTFFLQPAIRKVITPAPTVNSVIFRTIAAFILLMITSRILGKQTISNMTFHDFVSDITLGAIAANLAFNDKLNDWLIVVSLLMFDSKKKK